MRISLEIADYNPLVGVVTEWADEGRVNVRRDVDGSVIIEANADGLISLAKLFLFLALESVPAGSHSHQGDYNDLDDGSLELTVAKKV